MTGQVCVKKFDTNDDVSICIDTRLFPNRRKLTVCHCLVGILHTPEQQKHTMTCHVLHTIDGTHILLWL